MLLGVTGMGLFLGLLLKVNYGTETCTFMNASLANRFGITVGTMMVIANIVLFIPQLIWGRKFIGLGTLGNMFLIGPVCDLTTLFADRFAPQFLFQALPYRPLFFVIALVGFLFCAALYMNSGTGLSPFDADSKLLNQLIPLPFYIVRIFWDVAAIVVGLLAGGTLTVATVILALTLGPTVSFVGKYI